MLFRSTVISSLAAALMIAATPAHAQESLTLKEETKRDKKKVLGWTPSAKVGVNASLSSSSNVIGKAEGSSETYGVDLKGDYDFASERSEWRNSLSYAGTTTKTPTLPRYVKGNDLLKLESLYLFNFEDFPKLGPYANFTASAPVFFGEDVRGSTTTYAMRQLDGTTRTESGTSLKLTDGFRPLTTRESTGVFWKAFNDGNVRIEVRGGVGAEQTAAAGQYAVTETAADGTVMVMVKELRNLSVLGIETGVTGKGKIDEKTGWEIGIETLTPLVANKEAGDDRDPIRLTSVDGTAKLSSNLREWASLSYDYKLAIKPLLLDRAQQSHMLVLNINYNLL